MKPLAKPPIVEAVVDIDCDLPVGFDLPAIEALCRKAFSEDYPSFRTQSLQEHRVEQRGGREPEISDHRSIAALQFLTADEKQVVQVRPQGFSFNRLAPYSSLDDYRPEIERTWQLFRAITEPVQVRVVRLRYINRILLPRGEDGAFDLKSYLHAEPVLRGNKEYAFTSFMHQDSAVEISTGNELNVVLASQPLEGDRFPIIFDITAARPGGIAPDNWEDIVARIASLRELKNRVFESTLTKQCLKLFR